MATVTPPASERRSASRLASGAYVLVIAGLTALAASGMSGWQLAGLLGLAALGLLAVFVRRAHPYGLLAVAWATTVVATQVLLIPALFNLGVRRKGRGGAIGILVTLVLLAAVAGRGERLVSIDGVDLETWTSVGSWLLNSVVVVIVPYLIGSAVGARRDLTNIYRLRAEHGEAERYARATEAVLLERARIAREAHDVLGHKLSLLTMQAGGLELNAGAGPEVVEEQARRIRRSARGALDDLRHIISSIETPDPVEDGPERSLVPQDVFGIKSLVAESRLSGAIVDLSSSDLVAPETLSETTSRAAYRIVQECLTNAHRHAPGAPVIVSLSGSPGTMVVIEVRNSVTTSARNGALSGTGGRGLPGLQERARTVGGGLEVTEKDSVFFVRAELPWPRRDEEQGEGQS